MSKFISELQHHPQKAATIGRLVVGYGEIEFCAGACISHLIPDRNIMSAFRLLSSVRSEAARMEIMDSIVRPAIKNTEFSEQHDQTVKAVGCCRKIRNQYAHASWVTIDGWLTCVSIDRFFDGPKIKGQDLRCITDELLDSQEAYFVATKDALKWMNRAIASTVLEEEPPSEPFPAIPHQPKLYRTPKELLRLYPELAPPGPEK